MIFTFYDSPSSKKAHPQDLPWDELKVLLSTHIDQEAKGGAVFIPGTLPKNARHIAKNVENITALALDLDEISQDELLLILSQLARWEYVYYTTHSHSNAAIKARVVLPLAKPITPRQFPDAWERISAYIGYRNDQKAKDISRLYYLPSARKGAPKEAFTNEGKFLTLEQLPAVVTVVANPSQKKTSVSAVQRVIRRALQKIKDPDILELWELVLNGEVIATSGERHNTLLTLTMFLARHCPQSAPHSLAKIFTPSLEKMAKEAGAPTFDEAVQMIASAQKKIAEDQLKKTNCAKSSDSYKINHARGDGQTTPYTLEELQQIATVQGCTPEELSQRWIVYLGGSYYFLTLNGYIGPFIADGPAIADTYLKPANINVVDFTGKEKKPRLKAMNEILRWHGTPATAVVSDITIQQSIYDAHRKTLREATAARIADLKARRHAEVQTWLECMGGRKSDKLLDWVALAPQTDKTICALALSGKSGTGKSLLAFGLSRLWGNGTPTDIDETMGDFNERLAQNPLIFADEYIPKKWGRSVIGDIRKLISAGTTTIRRKHKPTALLEGSPRLIIASNETQTLLEGDESIGREGQEALAKRILSIYACDAAITYLKKLSQPTRDAFVRFAIAEHALWLSENREVMSGERFYIEGELDTTARTLNLSQVNVSLVCEWLAGYVLNPDKVDASGEKLILADMGRLFVNNQVFQKYWGQYHKSQAQLSSLKIARALPILSKEAKSKVIKVTPANRGPTRLRYWEIDTENLIVWAEANNWSLREELESRLMERHDNAIPEEEPF